MSAQESDVKTAKLRKRLEALDKVYEPAMHELMSLLPIGSIVRCEIQADQLNLTEATIIGHKIEPLYLRFYAYVRVRMHTPHQTARDVPLDKVWLVTKS